MFKKTNTDNNNNNKNDSKKKMQTTLVYQWVWFCIRFMPEADVYVMHFTILMPVSVVISPRVVHSWCLTCLGAEYYFFPWKLSAAFY